MASRKSILNRIGKYWFAERGMGRKSRASKLANWVTLYPLRRSVTELIVRSFEFQIPDWVGQLQRVVYKPDSRIRWHDYINPVYWLMWWVGSFYQWLMSRPYLTLGPALPAIIAGLTLSIFTVQRMIEKKDWRSNEYRATLNKAIQAKNDELAQLALTNLIHWEPSNVDYRIQQALLAAKLGKSESATKAMMSLAMNQRNAMAAAWLVANRFPRPDQSSKWSDADHQDFRMLMAIWLEGAKGMEELRAQTWMANYSIGINAISDAVRLLEPAADRNGDLLLLTARLHSQLGKKDAAIQWGEKAIRHYQDKLLKDPNDVQSRLNLATTLVLISREEEAARMLEDGYRMTKSGELLQASGEALAAQAHRMLTSEPRSDQSLLKRMRLIQRALKAAPKSPLVVETLVQTVVESAENSTEEVSRIRRDVMQGVDPGMQHFIQGTVFLFRGDLEQANVHLEIASKNAQDLPGVLNNMAVVLYQRQTPDLDRALQLSEAAVARLPDHPYIRETRGQILLRKKEYEKAILDLEVAAGAPELAEAVHTGLATAYEALKQSDLAEEHRALAELAKAKPTAGSRQ